VRVNRIKTSNEKQELTIKDQLDNLQAIIIENGRYNFGIIEFYDKKD